MRVVWSSVQSKQRFQMLKRFWCKLRGLFTRRLCMVTVNVCLLTEKKASRHCRDVYPASFEFKDIPDVCLFCQGEER